MKNYFTTLKIVSILIILFFLANSSFAYPWAHRYAAEQTTQNIVVDINTSFTVSVEWGEGGWDGTEGSMFGYGLSSDGSNWIWVDLPWFQDGGGSDKRCKTAISIALPGKYYYAYRMKKAANGGTSYSFGTSEWAENSATLIAYATIIVGKVSKADGPWTTASNWEGDVAPASTDNVAISNNITISTAVSVASVNVISGKILTINPGNSLSIAGTLTNNSVEGILLKSPIDNGAPGSLITNGTVTFTGSGTLKAERYISKYTNDADGWHLLSSPVNAPNIVSNTNLTPGAGIDDFYAWDEVHNLWLDQKLVENGITSMVNGNGYLVAYETAETKFMTGTPNNSAVTFTNLSKTASKGDGWHLIGNPFPCTIKWNPTENNSYVLTNIGGIAKIMNNYGSYTNINADGFIPAMQGFFIQASSGTNMFTIPLNARTIETAAWNKSLENHRILLVANDLETQMMQESDITVNDQSTEGYDYQYDSHFLPLYAPQFYSKAGDELLSTNSLPSLPAESIIPFGFVKNISSSFSIELKESIADYNVYLKDLKTNTDQNLTETPVYNFTSEATDDPNRFLLHFLSTVGTDKPSCPAALRIYANAGNIYLSGSTGKSEVYVRNMLGQTVMLRSVNSDGLEVINAASLKAGIYVVSVVNSSQTISSKVIIK